MLTLEQMIKSEFWLLMNCGVVAKMYLFRTADQAKKLAKMNEDV